MQSPAVWLAEWQEWQLLRDLQKKNEYFFIQYTPPHWKAPGRLSTFYTSKNCLNSGHNPCGLGVPTTTSEHTVQPSTITHPIYVASHLCNHVCICGLDNPFHCSLVCNYQAFIGTRSSCMNQCSGTRAKTSEQPLYGTGVLRPTYIGLQVDGDILSCHEDLKVQFIYTEGFTWPLLVCTEQA